MSDLLQRGSTWLHEQRDKHVSHPVEYNRGEDTITVNATVGTTPFEIARAGELDAFAEHVESRDFLILVAELYFGGDFQEPAAGDLIKETIGGTVHFFEVAGPGGEEPAWRYSDPTKTTFRIHTKDSIDKA